MLKPNNKKIAIVGCAGSGKTYLAFQLQKKLNLPLFHLDDYYWKPDWERVDIEQFVEKHNELCEQDAWIIEGSYAQFLYYRVMHADVIIFLDLPRYLCIWHVVKRAILNYGKEIPGSPKNCKQRLFSMKFLYFLQWIWNFNTRSRPLIMHILDEVKDEKHIYMLKSTKEIQLFLEEHNY